MKYIKIFEDFSSAGQINEAVKETPLPGGFIQRNLDDTNAGEGLGYKNGVIYFDTNTTTPSKNMGTPGTLTVSTTDGKSMKQLEFADNNFRDQDRIISWQYTDHAKLSASRGSDGNKQSILAKNSGEASNKAYEILLNSTYMTATPGDPKVLGNMLRSFFEIRKMYPEYMTKNDLFKGFLNGIINQYPNPNFGMFTNMDDFSDNIKSKKYLGEIGTVLREVGVIKDASPK